MPVTLRSAESYKEKTQKMKETTLNVHFLDLHLDRVVKGSSKVSVNYPVRLWFWKLVRVAYETLIFPL